MVTVAIISYSPPPFQEERKIFQNLLDQTNQIQEKALLESTPFGIVFFQQKYVIVTLDKRTWIHSSIYPTVKVDLNNTNLIIDGYSVNLPDAELTKEMFPQVIFSPGAEMTAFELSVTLFDNKSESSVIFEIKTDILGRGTFKQYLLK